jgi:hypothetical protein
MRRRFTLAASVLLGAVLAAGASAMASVALADDPTASPGPLVFHVPQYLVYMESHATMDGPVRDNAYWLYIAPPDADGNFAVPGGDGSVWHYSGRLVGGPFTGEASRSRTPTSPAAPLPRSLWRRCGVDHARRPGARRFPPSPCAPARSKLGGGSSGRAARGLGPGPRSAPAAADCPIGLGWRP